MLLPYRLQEWAADRFSWVQYPVARKRGDRTDKIDAAVRYGLLGWLLWSIWAVPLAVLGALIFVIFG